MRFVAASDAAPIADTITGADRIARALSAAGATHAFGIPGGEVLALVDALERAGIRFMLAKHENAAGFMAEGLWHVTGALPVLVTTLGPGVTNAVTVIAHALQDRVPLVVITGCVDQALAESYTHQIFDHQAMLKPLLKASFRAAPGTEELVIAKALAVARRGRPGPVHVDLPIAVAEARAPVRAIAPPPRSAPALPADLSEASDLLAGARRPLVLAGLDLLNDANGTLARFVERSGAALLTTYKAKGIVPEEHPQVVGGVGLSPKADAIVRPLIERADVILLAGYDPIEMRQGWRHPFPAGTPVIDIVAEAMTHGMHGASLLLEGDVPAILDRLAAGLPPTRPDVWPEGEPQAVRSRFREAFAGDGGWGPHAVFTILREAAPAAPSRRRIPARIASCSARCGPATVRGGCCNRPASAQWAAPCRWRWARRSDRAGPRSASSGTRGSRWCWASSPSCAISPPRGRDIARRPKPRPHRAETAADGAHARRRRFRRHGFRRGRGRDGRPWHPRRQSRRPGARGEGRLRAAGLHAPRLRHRPVCL